MSACKRYGMKIIVTALLIGFGNAGAHPKGCCSEVMSDQEINNVIEEFTQKQLAIVGNPEELSMQGYCDILNELTNSLVKWEEDYPHLDKRFREISRNLEAGLEQKIKDGLVPII